MQLATQEFLRRQASQNQDSGLSYRELISLDNNHDGQLSRSETQNQIHSNDLALINTQLKMHKQLQTNFVFIDDTSMLFSQAELNSSLFPQGKAGISAHDVVQGGVADCYFLAALASLAEARPQAIINMITENTNGSFTVKLPGIASKITVSAPTAAELGKYAHAGKNGSTWVAVLEKAFAQHSYQQAWFKDAERGDLNNGTLGQGISPVTGHSTNTDTLALTWKSTTRQRLQAALGKQRIVTASVNNLWSQEKVKNQHNLSSHHVYSILSYDAKSDTLRVRNPWGPGSDATGFTHNDNANDGIFTLTMDEFYAQFTFIAYEEAH